jgi:hypothetical protein
VAWTPAGLPSTARASRSRDRSMAPLKCQASNWKAIEGNPNSPFSYQRIKRAN